MMKSHTYTMLLFATLFSMACSDRERSDDTNPIVAFAAEFRRDYPLSEARDFYKSLYQESFGPGHIISSWDRARMGLEAEIASMPDYDEPWLIEPCGPSGMMLRLNIRRALRAGITTDTMLMLMRESIERLKPDTLAFLKRWDAVRTLAQAGSLPWTAAEIEALDATLGPEGLDVVHHSNVYAMNYFPAYRVIMTEVFNEWEARNGNRSTE